MQPSPDCPWHSLSFAAIDFCEESICGRVQQPGNTVSNLGVYHGRLADFPPYPQGHQNLVPLAYIAVEMGLTRTFLRLGNAHRGLDGGKPVNGRTRQRLSDMQGRILTCRVYAANGHDEVKPSSDCPRVRPGAI
jgi:hypothetical protein